MDKRYKCIICNYMTDKISNYSRHLNTTKHLLTKNGIKSPLNKNSQEAIANIQSDENEYYECDKCGMKFKRKSNKTCHETTCRFTTSIINNTSYEKIIDTLKEQLAIVTKLAIDKPSVSYHNTLTYISNKYPNPEPLKPLDDYAPVMLKEYKYIKDKDDDLNFEYDDTHELLLSNNYNQQFVDAVITFKRLNTLHVVLGDFLISNYVKNDKKQQSLHLVDSSRNKFVFAVLKDGLKNKIQWSEDVKGINVINIIIEPMLNFVYVQINHRYHQIGADFSNKNKKATASEIEELEACQELINMCSKINKRKKSFELARKILDYIAPYFHIDKPKLLHE
jgi:ribonucleotide reductase beta subunit family protein with ferritin-like domain